MPRMLFNRASDLLKLSLLFTSRFYSTNSSSNHLSPAHIAMIKIIDLEQYRTKPYVVVDPFDPSSLLYLNHAQYTKFAVTQLSNDSTLQVIARPGQLDLIMEIQAKAATPPHLPGEDITEEEVISCIGTWTPWMVCDLDGNFPDPFIPFGEEGRWLGGTFTEHFRYWLTVSSQTRLDPAEYFFQPLALRQIRNYISSFRNGPTPTFNYWRSDFSKSSGKIDFLGTLSKNKFLLKSLVIQGSESIRQVIDNSMFDPSSEKLGKILHSWASLLSSKINLRRTSVFVSGIDHLVDHCQHILDHNGSLYLAKYLKISLLATYRYLAGSPYTDTRPLGLSISLDKSGIPRILPVGARTLIRGRHLGFIRCYVSLLNSFKAMKVVYPLPSFSTIEGMPGTYEETRHHSIIFWKSLSAAFRVPLDSMINSMKNQFKRAFILNNSSSGPNVRPSSMGFYHDFWAWKHYGSSGLLLSFMKLVDTRNLLKLWSDLENGKDHVDPFDSESVHWLRRSLRDPLLRLPSHLFSKVPKLGKLGLKYEAAGKVRVFAIVDSWTQAILKPLHDFFADLLKFLPTDATFDQLGALHKFMEHGIKTTYSFDLTAATDCIPVELYRQVFTPILGEDFTNRWLDLLVARRYWIPKSQGLEVKILTSNGKPFVIYTVGQPIGARSSWPSMALVHHYLVFLAAARAGLYSGALGAVIFFIYYLILGDDLVIGSRSVANAYLEICEEFGIPINRFKSIESEEGFVNFANKYLLANGVDVSPYSLKEEISISSLPMRFEAVIRMVRIGWRNFPSLENSFPVTKFLHLVLPSNDKGSPSTWSFTDASWAGLVSFMFRLVTSGQVSDIMSVITLCGLFISKRSLSVLSEFHKYGMFGSPRLAVIRAENLLLVLLLIVCRRLGNLWEQTIQQSWSPRVALFNVMKAVTNLPTLNGDLPLPFSPDILREVFKGSIRSIGLSYRYRVNSKLDLIYRLLGELARIWPDSGKDKTDLCIHMVMLLKELNALCDLLQDTLRVTEKDLCNPPKEDTKPLDGGYLYPDIREVIELSDSLQHPVTHALYESYMTDPFKDLVLPTGRNDVVIPGPISPLLLWVNLTEGGGTQLVNWISYYVTGVSTYYLTGVGIAGVVTGFHRPIVTYCAEEDESDILDSSTLTSHPFLSPIDTFSCFYDRPSSPELDLFNNNWSRRLMQGKDWSAWQAELDALKAELAEEGDSDEDDSEECDS